VASGVILRVTVAWGVATARECLVRLTIASADRHGGALPFPSDRIARRLRVPPPRVVGEWCWRLACDDGALARFVATVFIVWGRTRVDFRDDRRTAGTPELSFATLRAICGPHTAFRPIA
jgi:hypothetical protein